MPINEPAPKALLFDVFGTTVAWRSAVLRTLISESRHALTTTLSATARSRAAALSDDDWGAFLQEWRDAYYEYCSVVSSSNGPPPKTCDQLHLDALRDLVAKWGIESLWTDKQLVQLSLAWHDLDPYADSVEGTKRLTERFVTATLSNGNKELLDDLVANAGVTFNHVFAADEFGSLKRASKVYLGAVKELGFKPHEVMMVACHLSDLEAARSSGLRTCYVERAGEEQYGKADVDRCRSTEGLIEIWVEEGNDGFFGVTRALEAYS